MTLLQRVTMLEELAGAQAASFPRLSAMPNLPAELPPLGGIGMLQYAVIAISPEDFPLISEEYFYFVEH